MKNLDPLSQDDLIAFWLTYRACSEHEAQKLIGDTKPGATKVAALLASYAFARYSANDLRARGKKQSAESYERGCDIYFNMLPPGLKWDKNTPKPRAEKKQIAPKPKQSNTKKQAKPLESQPVLITTPVCLDEPACYGEFFIMHLTDGSTVQCRRRRDLLRRAAKKGWTYVSVLPIEHVAECPCHGQVRHVSDVVGSPDQQEETKVL